MNDSFELSTTPHCSMTIDCDVFFLDGPADHTVRPCRPSLLEHAKAERAKILAAQAAQEGQTPPQSENQS